MNRSFRVNGPLPGMNEIVAAAKSGRGRGNAYSRQKSAWTLVVAKAARDARVGPFPLPVSLHLIWCEPNARRDPDNVHAGTKFVLDGLVDAGVIPGDRRKNIISILHDVVTDKENPGVIVNFLEHAK